MLRRASNRVTVALGRFNDEFLGLVVFVPILSRRCAASVTYSGGAREQLHALRKAIKKLRYGIEFALHPHKQVKANLRPCKSLQELLGTVNDAAVTLTLSEQLPKTGEELTQGIGALEVWAGDRARGRFSWQRIINPPAWLLCFVRRSFWSGVHFESSLAMAQGASNLRKRQQTAVFSASPSAAFIRCCRRGSQLRCASAVFVLRFG